MFPIGIESREKVQFNTIAKRIGNSIYIRLPPSYLSHLNLTQLKDPDGPDELPMVLQAEYNDEHGKYGSHWNPQQQNEGEDQ